MSERRDGDGDLIPDPDPVDQTMLVPTVDMLCHIAGQVMLAAEAVADKEPDHAKVLMGLIDDMNGRVKQLRVLIKLMRFPELATGDGFRGAN